MHEQGCYTLTASGRDLAPIIRGLGQWALRWVDTDCSLANLDARLLMWNMRRNLRPDPLPQRRVVVAFHYPELPEAEAYFWLIVTPGQPVDLCSIDPGHDPDLLVTAELRAMTAAWMGMASFTTEISAKRIQLDGARALASSFTKWIGQSSLAA
jgi:hypothetical protein